MEISTSSAKRRPNVGALSLSPTHKLVSEQRADTLPGHALPTDGPYLDSVTGPPAKRYVARIRLPRPESSLSDGVRTCDK